MKRRDLLVAVGGIAAGVLLALVLLGSVLTRPGTASDARPRVFLNRGPAPTTRPIADIETRIPQQFRFLAPMIPIERGISQTAREASGLLFLLLLTSGTLVFARQQVARAYATSAGGWREQARVLGAGVGVTFVLASAVLLGAVFLLAWLTRTAPGVLVVGLQLLFGVVSLALLLVAIAALVGFSAASWRLGVRVLSLPAWREAGQRVPAVLAALLGAALLYVLTQIPLLGGAIAVAILAYSLGAFVLARLAPEVVAS